MNHALDPQIPRYGAADGIARITLARPAHRNRLQNEDLAALMDHFAQIDADASIRVVVLSGDVLDERPVFSAGYHIGQYEQGRPALPFEEISNALEKLRPVTICELNGSVYGGATDLVLACDFAIARDDVEMRMPAAALGIHPYPGGLSRYVSRLGVSNAKRAFLTAKLFNAQELLQMGYVHELVAPSQLRGTVDALAAHIASHAPIAVQSVKQSINEIARGDFDRERLLARELASIATEDFAEGRRAFAERRTPVWKGR
jgi:enoyl-CoA hydratase/carnithine racemase